VKTAVTPSHGLHQLCRGAAVSYLYERSLESRARVMRLLELLQAGRAPQEIGKLLPNHLKPRSEGLSERTLERLTRVAVRRLLAALSQEHRPQWVPQSLWPPDEVRASIKLQASPVRKHRLLKAWLSGSWSVA